jgi:nicotinate phosphoribosyltransferase
MDVLDPSRAALTTDLQSLAGAAAYFPGKKQLRGCFELSLRSLPPGRGVLLAAGLDQVVDYLQELRFSQDELRYLRNLFIFKEVDTGFWDWLASFRFTGRLWAVPEGTPVFVGEPLLQVEAPISEALLVESYLLSTVSYQSLVATSAARLAQAANGRGIVEAGLRRCHGPAAGALAARASYLAGAVGTTNAEAGAYLGIPVFSSMPPSFLASFASEEEAFRCYGTAFPAAAVLKLDTHDPVRAARQVCELGLPVHVVSMGPEAAREWAPEVRRILDAAGLTRTRVLVMDDLDEEGVARLCANQLPIDLIGMEGALAAASDTPVLDAHYALVEYTDKDEPVRVAWKRDGTLGWPGAKQTFRSFDVNGVIREDVIGLKGEDLPGAPLLQPALEDGRLAFQKPGLESIRKYVRQALSSLPPGLLRSTQPGITPRHSPELEALRATDEERSPDGQP